MSTKDTGELLRAFAEKGSETAFQELVARYIDLVYSVALRRVGGDAHQAQDVAQTVFTDFAGKARSLSSGVQLGGWLHRHTASLPPISRGASAAVRLANKLPSK